MKNIYGPIDGDARRYWDIELGFQPAPLCWDSYRPERGPGLDWFGLSARPCLALKGQSSKEKSIRKNEMYTVYLHYTIKA